jgi:aerobic-type carbon monoxide dehydrogenase small subunit (CoxS/CutS family)
MSAPGRRLTVNGTARALGEMPDAERLLDTLRWRLGLKGTKEGCRTGDCGACTVLVGGRPTLACLTLTREVEEEAVVTVEGIADLPEGRRVQAAFVAEGAAQCGYCTPGFVVALTALLRESPVAPPDELLDGLQGNLCRCTGYGSIGRAVRRLAQERP